MVRKGKPVLEFDHTIVANEYGFYCMPDAYFGREVGNVLRNGGVYEPATLKFLTRHIGTGDVVSGGAFVGDFFPALCSALAPKAQLHSFEPLPITFAACQETIRLNGLTSVKLHQVAVGDKPDTVMMQVARPGGDSLAAGAKIVSDVAKSDPRVVPVKLATIDSLVPKSRKVSVLHLDVEGFEIPALNGATRILRDHAPMVLLESGRAWQDRQYLERLNDLAPGAEYRLAGSIERNAIYISDPV